MTRAANNDALQLRLARFINEVPSARSIYDTHEFSIGTSIGSVRKQNQDRAVLVIAKYGDRTRDFTLAVVCDGVGGLAKGDIAATVAASAFITRVLRTARMPVGDRLRGAAEDANAAVYDLFGGKGGTTLSAVLLSEKDGVFGLNIGDSRIYGLDNARKPVQLSKDDTLAGYFGGEGHDQRNRLVQFVGLGEGLDPNVFRIDYKVYPTLLISTDGAHGAPVETFGQVCRSADTSSALVRRLLNLSDMLGGRDNATATALSSDASVFSSISDQGLNLTFYSAWNMLEIWLPVVVDESQPQQISQSEGAPEAKGEDQQVKKARGGSKSRRGKKKQPRNDLKLPLDEERPEVEVKFPGKAED